MKTALLNSVVKREKNVFEVQSNFLNTQCVQQAQGSAFEFS